MALPEPKQTPLHEAIIGRELEGAPFKAEMDSERRVTITIPAGMTMPTQQTKTRVEKALVRYRACGSRIDETGRKRIPDVVWVQGTKGFNEPDTASSEEKSKKRRGKKKRSFARKPKRSNEDGGLGGALNT